MPRTTKADIEGMFKRLTSAGKALGFNNVDGWHIYSAYGNKYWLYETVNGSGGVSGLFMPDGFLGVGTKAAHDNLFAITRTLEEIIYRIDPTTRPERQLAKVSLYTGP
jgi:hypothetical protein